ncbi:MAG: PhnD/SsuA/transferrin family substrate-binding protein [Spirulina sp. SIO3F2]|nr:PhnD/SsuA/transferrin family substrate-binding protein [Spirulina sp. SIO3F2]
MKRRYFLGYACLFLASCTATQQRGDAGLGTPANALPETLSFAVTDVEGLEELEADHELFRQALEAALGSKIEFFPIDSPVAAAPAMLNGEIDLAWAGPSEYLILQARAKAVPVVSLKRSDFKSVIAVRADSGIQSLTDLKGKTIDMYKLGVNSTHIGGSQMLLAAGIDPQTDIQIVTSKSYSLQGLKNGEFDAVVRASHRYKTVIEEEELPANDYPIIATGELLPGDIFVASNQLDAAAVEIIQTKMLEHQEQLMAAILETPNLARKFKNAALIPVNTDEYEAFRDVYQAIGQEELIQ